MVSPEKQMFQNYTTQIQENSNFLLDLKATCVPFFFRMFSVANKISFLQI